MIDTEVIRLRRLRNTALQARAIAIALHAGRSRLPADDTVFSRVALACWRIARAVTGKLRAHPYQRYQRDPGHLRSLYDRIAAAVIGGIARYRKRSFGMYSARLQQVSRQLDDGRALTWSPSLSDILGRSQIEIRGLIQELAVGARQEACGREEAGIYAQAVAGVDSSGSGSRTEASRIATNWPYLAI
jgi:hypothetical protein